MNQQKTLKSRTDFYCEPCDYLTSRRGDYHKHCTTRKHATQCKINGCQPKSHEPELSEPNTYICLLCSKVYKDRSGLWRHKQQCVINSQEKVETSDILLVETILDNDNVINEPVQNDNSFTVSNDLIIEFIKQNHELKSILLEERQESRNRFNEQTAKIEELSKQNVVINNNNNNFNLNIFLNEKCKDAISMIDFINSLQVGTMDVEYTGRHGYVEGITKIFIDGLKQLDVYKRPIHCTDLKRETLYIKEDETWEKDNHEKAKFKKAIGAVVRKNIQQIRRWQEENPKCNILDSNEYVLHMSIMRQSLGGGNQEKTDRNNEKIIKNVAKQVTVDRTNF